MALNLWGSESVGAGLELRDVFTVRICKTHYIWCLKAIQATRCSVSRDFTGDGRGGKLAPRSGAEITVSGAEKVGREARKQALFFVNTNSGAASELISLKKALFAVFCKFMLDVCAPIRCAQKNLRCTQKYFETA
jgi:hypothetical protein